jgi:hypothetical protein
MPRKGRAITSDPKQGRNTAVANPSQPSVEYVDSRVELKEPHADMPIQAGQSKEVHVEPTAQLTAEDFPDKAFTCTVVGSRRSGKTTVTESLLMAMKDRFDCVFLFSATLSGFETIPNSYKFANLAPMAEIIRRQQNVTAYNEGALREEPRVLCLR